jgi:archaellum component FlaC
MRLPSVPGPSDVLAAMGGVKDGFTEALALVPRVVDAVGHMEDLLGRVSTLLTRVDGIVDRADVAIDAVDRTRVLADAAIAGVGATQTKADAAIMDVARTNTKADTAIEAVGRTTARADETLGTAAALVGRVDPLLADYEPALAALAPSVQRLASTIDPQEVEALVMLIDRLPRLVRHLDEDILPVLESLGDVGTDVHDLVDVVQDLRQIVKGFPGSRLFRRRGAEEIAQEAAEESRVDLDS